MRDQGAEEVVVEIEEEVVEVDVGAEDEGAQEDAEVPEEEAGEAPGDVAPLAIKPSRNLCFVFLDSSHFRILS